MWNRPPVFQSSNFKSSKFQFSKPPFHFFYSNYNKIVVCILLIIFYFFVAQHETAQSRDFSWVCTSVYSWSMYTELCRIMLVKTPIFSNPSCWMSWDPPSRFSSTPCPLTRVSGVTLGQLHLRQNVLRKFLHLVHTFGLLLWSRRFFCVVCVCAACIWHARV